MDITVSYDSVALLLDAINRLMLLQERSLSKPEYDVLEKFRLELVDTVEKLNIIGVTQTGD